MSFDGALANRSAMAAGQGISESDRIGAPARLREGDPSGVASITSTTMIRDALRWCVEPSIASVANATAVSTRSNWSCRDVIVDGLGTPTIGCRDCRTVSVASVPSLQSTRRRPHLVKHLEAAIGITPGAF